ncbi:MAG: VOC family protein [Candidatus Heimdallarchaeota archaeon]|nr:VOC family protein [Candidatus Heimdallarchaeota archaeon]MDH5645167.1 VOC family protein [Candidatus Heimdallarchaeota archaeon]
MEINSIRLLTDKFDEMLDFYLNKVGLTKHLLVPNIYAEFELSNSLLAIYQRKLMDKILQIKDRQLAEFQEKTIIVIRVSDIDKTYIDLKNKGIFFLNKPTIQEEWYLKTAHFRDPDGNIIELNTPYRSGLEL